ncbi:hypothetical protein [Endozoicomonas ascidiicola]|uniref:hypothetical protein n=1 Tax=Endozoicomonas ascidiicola TaxID=1698521 RepID=UPI000833DF8C|nr:hypothetical protein [Endozoicomonas ascidiicola]
MANSVSDSSSTSGGSYFAQVKSPQGNAVFEGMQVELAESAFSTVNQQLNVFSPVQRKELLKRLVEVHNDSKDVKNASAQIFNGTREPEAFSAKYPNVTSFIQSKLINELGLERNQVAKTAFAIGKFDFFQAGVSEYPNDLEMSQVRCFEKLFAEFGTDSAFFNIFLCVNSHDIIFPGQQESARRLFDMKEAANLENIEGRPQQGAAECPYLALLNCSGLWGTEVPMLARKLNLSEPQRGQDLELQWLELLNNHFCRGEHAPMANLIDALRQCGNEQGAQEVEGQYPHWP